MRVPIGAVYGDMAFLAAINARRKPESAGASSPGDPMPFDSTDNTTTSRQRISSRPSIDSTTRPSMAPRPSLGKRGSISFSLEDVCAPLTEGREGTKMGAMSKKLKDIKELTDEKVELLYESFQMFPLDPDGRLTAEGLGTYYSRAGLVFTPDQCETMIKLFSGGTRDSLDFDEYAVAFIRCEKTLPVRCIYD